VWPESGAEPFCTGPNGVAVEGRLYSLAADDEPADDAFEQRLAQHVDGPTAPLFEKLVREGTLTGDERLQFAYYLALQEFRTPRMRDLVKGMTSQIMNGVLEHLASDPENFKKIGAPLPVGLGEEILDAIRTGGIVAEATNAAWLQLVTAPLELAPTIAELDWAVATAPGDIEFITTDTPIVKVLVDRSVPPQFAGGWCSPSAESTLALDPSHVLVIRPEGLNGHSPAPRRWMMDVNARACRQAHRFVISRRREAFISKILQKKNLRRSRPSD
jgi:hypothetical protein